MGDVADPGTLNTFFWEIHAQLVGQHLGQRIAGSQKHMVCKEKSRHRSQRRGHGFGALATAVCSGILDGDKRRRRKSDAVRMYLQRDTCGLTVIYTALESSKSISAPCPTSVSQKHSRVQQHCIAALSPSSPSFPTGRRHCLRL